MQIIFVKILVKSENADYICKVLIKHYRFVNDLTKINLQI